MTSVSVVIPTHNRSAQLKQAIESVLATKTASLELEILIVDDGSTDDTAEVVKSYPVVYLPQPGGNGPAGSRNIGIAAARGDYIAFLDDDDVWLPTNLTAQLQVFADHPDDGMVFAQMWLTDNALAARIGPFPPADQPQWHMQDLLRFIPQVGTIVVRRAVAQEMPFDTTFRWAEDWDWILRIAQRYPVGYAHVPVLLYCKRETGENLPWGQYRDTMRVFRRHARAFGLAERLRLEPILWSRRGWFAALFMQQASDQRRARRYSQSRQALWRALRASPPHVAILLARASLAKLKPGRAAPATQPQNS